MRAVILSVFFGFVAVALQYWNPPGLLAFLLNAVGGCLIVLWFAITFSFLRIHPQLVKGDEITHVRMWAPGVLPWATVVLAGAIVVLMLTNPDGRFQMFAVAVVVGIISIAGVLWTRTDTFQQRAKDAAERNIR